MVVLVLLCIVVNAEPPMVAQGSLITLRTDDHTAAGSAAAPVQGMTSAAGVTSAGGTPSCVQSGDDAAGLSLCFTGPQVSATSADKRPLAEHTSGFSLLVHSNTTEPKLL